MVWRWFETYSVLTRLPSPARRTMVEVHRILERNFPESRFLSEVQTRDLIGRLSSLGIAGSAVYDALVGAAASAHDLPLASRDIRAGELYRSLGVTVELLT